MLEAEVEEEDRLQVEVVEELLLLCNLLRVEEERVARREQVVEQAQQVEEVVDPLLWQNLKVAED